MTDLERFNTFTSLCFWFVIICLVAIFLSGCTHVQYDSTTGIVDIKGVGGMKAEDIVIQTEDGKTVKIGTVEREWWADIATAIILIWL